jgi:hypothetical protein
VQFCCGEVCCNEGETCCDGVCCPEDEYCCDGVCQEEPCEEPECETDEDCATCPEGTTTLSGEDDQLFCCDFLQAGTEAEPTETECGLRYLGVGTIEGFGETCRAELYDCPDPDDNEIFPVPNAEPTEGYCCDGECSEEECPP